MTDRPACATLRLRMERVRSDVVERRGVVGRTQRFKQEIFEKAGRR